AAGNQACELKRDGVELVGFEGSGAAAGGGAVVVENLVLGDSTEPAGKGEVSVISSEALPCGNDGVLNDVVGRRGVESGGADERGEGELVFAHEDFENGFACGVR